MDRIVEKPWGREIIWAETEYYVGKILEITNGHKLSRQYHVVKDETIRVLEGILTLELGEDGQQIQYLSPGDSWHVTPGTIHRFSADNLSDVVLLEVSTTELGDVVRIEDDYNRA